MTTDGKDQQKQDRRNTLAVGLFAGAMAGFILSMLLGAFNVGKMGNVPGWLQGVFSGMSTLVSVYAVYLVSQTLKATRDALDATIEMAADQKRFGDSETRAWLFAEQGDVRYKSHQQGFMQIPIKNFGRTPAMNIKFKIILRSSIENGQSKAKVYFPLQQGQIFLYATKDYIASGGLHIVEIPFLTCAENAHFANLRLYAEYYSVHQADKLKAVVDINFQDGGKLQRADFKTRNIFDEELYDEEVIREQRLLFGNP